MTDSRTYHDVIIALGISVLALIIYCVTLSIGAYPGMFAFYLTQDMGLFPRLAPDRPLWALISVCLRHMPSAGDSALPFNLLSAIFGAGGIFLTYWIVRNAIVLCIRNEREGPRMLLAARLGGAAAGLALAFCSPYWTVATRGYWGPFQVFTLLLVSWLFLRILKGGLNRDTVIFCFLYGLGIVEYPTFAIFAPLFASGLLWSIWKRERLTVRYCATLVGCTLAGLLLYIPAAVAFYGSLGYELKEYGGFHEIVWYMWRDQWWLISRGLPKQGWLLVLILTAVPWLTSLALAKRALAGELDWSSHVLHIVITGVVVAVLLNVKIAPWPMLGTTKLLVFPYVLIASLFGYLVAYWTVVPERWVESTSQRRKAVAPLGIAIVILAFIFLALLPFRNFADGNARHAEIVRDFANDVVRSAGDKPWLLTSGVWDPHLLIAAEEQGKPIKLLDLSRSSDERYHVYVSRFFESPKLRNRLRVGLMPMLREWAATDADFENKCTVEGNPDIWIALGYSPIPNLLVFDGTREPEKLRADELMDSHAGFWNESNISALRVEKMGKLVRLGRRMLRQASVGANNFGVLMEDLGHEEFAFKAYQEAREIDARNVSALLNMNTMINRGYSTPLRQEIESDLEKFSSELAGLRLHQISKLHGAIRSPDAYADEGWAWARSTTPARSIPLLLKSIELHSPRSSLAVRHTLADVYRLEGLDDESRALYYEILVENPNSQRALIGMARLAMKNGERAEARRYLEKAEAAGMPPALKSMEWATYHVLGGETQTAVELLKDLAKSKPDLVRAWSMLADIYIQQEDEEGLLECAKKLRRLPARNPVLPLVEGHLARMQYDLESAVRSFEEALIHSPNDLGILVWLLRLAAALRDHETTTARAKQILQLDPDHPLANRVLGVLFLTEKEYELAANSLNRVLEFSEYRDPLALKDLAWVLQESELYEEAERHARRALELDENLPSAWATLGLILMKTDRTGEARQAFECALAIDEKHVAAVLHLAELYLAEGNNASATALLEEWKGKRESLSRDAIEKFDKLTDAL